MKKKNLQMMPQRINLQNIQTVYVVQYPKKKKKKIDFFNGENAKYLRMTYKERKLI